MLTVGNSVNNKFECRNLGIAFFGVIMALSISGNATLAQASSKARSSENVTIRSASLGAPKKIVANQYNQDAAPALRLASPGDRCEGKLGGDPIWLIGGWLIGNETYTAYQDPSINCLGAYPFTIDTVHIFLEFNKGSSGTVPFALPISISIRDLDTTTSGCPTPGAVLFTGSPGMVNIPSKDFFDISIPLDVPFEINGPYFVDFTFNDTVPFSWGVELVTDEFEAFCVSYNNWDSTIGFIDMGDDTLIHQNAFEVSDPCFSAAPNTPGCFDFDGRLLLWSNGVTGSEPPVAMPGIAILSPDVDEKLYGSTDIWVAETSGSPIIDSAVFYQRTNSTSWTRIGVDVNQDMAFGRGAAFGAGQGLSYLWDFSAETEETHWIKVEVFDSLLQSAVDSVSVFLEPTPPVPVLSVPEYFSRFCDTLTLTYDLFDEDPASVLLQKKQADLQFSQGLETQYQFDLGDVDGDTADGNPASQGEFGDYYGGPVVGALALRYWHDQGYIQSLRVGSATLTNSQASERLADFMKVRAKGDLSDESFVLGFREYLLVTGFRELEFEFKRQISYAALRNWNEDYGVCAMIRIEGTGGEAGKWFAVDGYDGLPTLENSFRVRVSDPSDGIIKILLWRDFAGGSEVFYQGSWYTVDIIGGVIPTSWSISGRSGIGVKFSPGSQSSFLLDSAANGLTDGGLYFIIAQLTDQNSNLGEFSTLLELNCASFTIGDYDGNGRSNISDLVYLVNYQINGGPAPVGGAARADVNCGGTIDTADLIFYINWIFVGGDAPCR